jgi:hypothetical protein
MLYKQSKGGMGGSSLGRRRLNRPNFIFVTKLAQIVNQLATSNQDIAQHLQSNALDEVR